MSTNRAMSRRRRRRRRIMQKVIPAVIAIVLIVIILIVGKVTGLFDNFSYSSDKADLYSYFGVSSEDYAAVIQDGTLSEKQLKIVNGTAYLDLDTVKENYVDRFYYDVNDNALLYTTETDVISAMIGEAVYSIQGISTQTPYVISMLEGDTLYVALDYVKLYATLSYQLYGGNGEPYRTELLRAGRTVNRADIDKEQAVRLEADKKSAILAEPEAGTAVTVLEQTEDWSRVQTQDLIVGYIETKYLGNFREEAETVEEVIEPAFASLTKDTPIVLAWDMVTNADANSYISDRLAAASGLTTISPTWFSLADNNGTVASIASQAYVDTAHVKGLEVWGLIDNMTYPEVSTFDILSYSEKRAHVIEQLMGYAEQYGLDGINVDFESLSGDAGEPFIQFIRELSIECRKAGLILSVDNYVPEAYTDHYNRKEQGVFADYVIIMGYDEHYSGSAESGSVASLDYVTNGIQKTIAEVPANKVINAVPLYTRIWIETPKTEAEIAAEDANTEFVPYKLSLQTVAMADAVSAVRNAGATATWDETTAQNYAEWTKDGATYKVWLEDSQSLSAKLQVMANNNLAGVAAWQLGYADSSVWEVFNQFY